MTGGASVTEVAALRADVAATARQLAAAGLVEAFGHVSARLPGGGLVITSTRPMAAATAADTLVLRDDLSVVDGPASDRPLEAPLHAAVYRARPDVAAIARGHGRSTVAWGTGIAELPVRHGLGLMVGLRVPVHPEVLLISTQERAAAVAATLADGHAVLLRANGAFTTGPDLLTAATRLHALEERAAVALLARDDAPVDPDIWQQRSQDSEVELRRACRWFASRFAVPSGDDAAAGRSSTVTDGATPGTCHRPDDTGASRTD